VKICYLMPRMLPTPSGAVVGGSATNCVSLALELKRQGAAIELLASVSSDGVDRLADKPVAGIVNPLPTIGRGFIGKGLGTLHVLRRGLKDRLRETHFDVVHSHSGTYPYAVVPLMVDHKSCVRLHSLYCPLGAKGGAYSSWWEKSALSRLVLERLDRVIAATENVRQSLENAGVRPEKIELVPMCVDAQRFHPMARPEPAKYFSGNGTCARILFIGNASKEKGLLGLLAAVKLLKEKGVPVSFVAAIENQCGIREYAAGYELARTFVHRAKIESLVRFVGLVHSIERLYAESDLVVIPWNTSRGPSDYPMVVLEAMAMGKCVVCTPVGGCPDLLAYGKAGMLTDGFSSQAIADAIEATVCNPTTRKKLEQSALKRAEDFSLVNSARQLLRLYEHLLEGKERHRV